MLRVALGLFGRVLGLAGQLRRLTLFARDLRLRLAAQARLKLLLMAQLLLGGVLLVPLLMRGRVLGMPLEQLCLMLGAALAAFGALALDARVQLRAAGLDARRARGMVCAEVVVEVVAPLAHVLDELGIILLDAVDEAVALDLEVGEHIVLGVAEQHGQLVRVALQMQQHLVGVDAAEVEVLVEEVLEHGAAGILVVRCAHAREHELHVALDLHLGIRAVEPLELLQLADIVHVVGNALLRPADIDGRAGIAQRALDRAAHRAGFDQLPGLEVPQLVIDLADMLGQVKAHALRAQLAVERDEPVARGDVHAHDGAAVDDDGLRIGLHRALNILLEAADVGEKQAAAEAVEHDVRQRLHAADAVDREEPGLARQRAEEGALGRGRAHEHVDERQHHAHEHALDRAEQQHAQKRPGEDAELHAVDAPEPPRDAELRRPDERVDDDGRQHRHGQEADERRGNEQHDEHGHARHDGHELRPAAVALVDGRARHAARHDAAADEPGGDVAHGIRRDLAAAVETVAVFLRRAGGSQQRLGQNDGRDRQRRHERLRKRQRGEVRQHDLRQAARHGGQQRDAPVVQRRERTEQPAGHHHHEHPRHLRPLARRDEQNCQRPEAERGGGPVDDFRCVKNVPQQLEQLARAGAGTEQFWHLHEDDLAADAADEPAHDGLGDVIDGLVRAHEREHGQPQRDVERQHRHDAHGLRAAGRDAERRDHRADHGGRRGVDAEDELPRRAEHRKQQDRHQRPVQPVDRRQAGQLGIAHRDRDGQQRNERAGEQIRPELRPVVPAQGGEQRLRKRFHSITWFFKIKCVPLRRAGGQARRRAGRCASPSAG